MSSIPLKIALVGAECTGKTSLAQALAQHLNTVWAPEYARLYTEAKWKAKWSTAISREDAIQIALGQACLEDHFASLAQGYLVCDTNLLSTAVYVRYYFGNIPDEIELLLAQRPAHQYYLLDAPLAWEPDPIRDTPEAKLAIQALFVEELTRRQLPYQLIQEPYLNHGTQNYPHRRLAHWADLL
jgi:HTH-type transcriptional regulator, transcriptional repressor of NAD biosynthesis genes